MKPGRSRPVSRSPQAPYRCSPSGCRSSRAGRRRTSRDHAPCQCPHRSGKTGLKSPKHKPVSHTKTRGRAMAKAVRKDEPIQALLKEGRKFPPPKHFTKMARVKTTAIYQQARRNPVRFWEERAKELRWIKPWRKSLEWKLPYAKWFI